MNICCSTVAQQDCKSRTSKHSQENASYQTLQSEILQYHKQSNIAGTWQKNNEINSENVICNMN